jgi:hypothetical protein
MDNNFLSNPLMERSPVGIQNFVKIREDNFYYVDKTLFIKSPLFYLLICVFLLSPVEAWAVQIHGPPEGLYVNILAHIFFTSSLLFFLYWLRKHPMGGGSGWKYLKYSLLFFLFWNLDTLMVHILSIRLPEEALSRPSQIWHHRLMPPLTWERLLYYVGRFDHLFCVPAIWFLVKSLKSFLHEKASLSL